MFMNNVYEKSMQHREEIEARPSCPAVGATTPFLDFLNEFFSHPIQGYDNHVVPQKVKIGCYS